ncbi:MAG: HD domain-containing protein [Devosiaceae bacterium]|nr:HD domain-containing protein [Devosiaceae bacterium MH13]
MPDERITAILGFLTAAGALKDTVRSSTTDGGRQESTAEHSWRLALWVIALEPHLEGYNIEKLLKLALLHDLGEAVTGDVPATEQSGDQGQRQDAERQAVASLGALLGPSDRERISAVYDAYDQPETPEGRLMKGLDKLETLLQHATGDNSEGFDYAFNLDYGRRWTDSEPLLAQVRRAIDAMTKARMSEGTPRNQA